MPDQTESQLSLTPNDLCGIVQRMLAELNAYLAQHPSQVDPNVVLSGLERCASFIGQLPRSQAPAANGNQKPEAARKN